VTAMDIELETWRREWHTYTEPLPELKRKIRRQNLQMIAAVAIICVCLALSTIEALRTQSSFIAGLAAGLWFTSLLVGSYAWWVRRRTWNPTAQTTAAYLELSYRRTIAKARTIRFSFYFLLSATVLFAVHSAWNWRAFSTREALIFAAFVSELFLFRHYRRRKKREIEETRKLMEQTRE
jgi:hypothetical protein